MADKKKNTGGAMRLDRLLGEMGIGSRSQIRKMAGKGLIAVNGTAVKAADVKVRPGADVILVEGRPVTYVAQEYYMLNKPQGVVSATEDKRETTVLDLIRDKKRKDLFPVGRLDKDTEGLLLITNDGELAHRLLSPKRHVDKVYYARVDGLVTEATKQAFLEGVNIGSREEPLRTMPARLEILRTGREGGRPVSHVRLTIREGKFHQVKRMFEALGCRVVYLKRLSMGPLVLDETLSPGQCRPLTDEELRKLSNA